MVGHNHSFVILSINLDRKAIFENTVIICHNVVKIIRLNFNDR